MPPLHANATNHNMCIFLTFFCYSSLAVFFFPSHKPTKITQKQFGSMWWKFKGSCGFLTPKDVKEGWYFLQTDKGHSFHRVHWHQMDKISFLSELATCWPTTSIIISLNTEGCGLAKFYHSIKVTWMDVSQS